jgi:WD40 repeat protein
MVRQRHVMTAPLTPQNTAEIIEIGSLGEDYAGPVQIIAFSPDGELLAASTYDSLHVWDVKRRKRLFQQELPAQSIAFHPDDSTVVAAGHDIIFLDVDSGEQKAILKGHPGGTTAVAFSPDGSLLASGGQDGLVRVGDLKTRRLAGKFEHPAPVRALAISPDGGTVAVISWATDSEPKQVYLWSLVTGEQRMTLPCTRERNLAFSPDGTRLAVDSKLFYLADEDRRVLYDLNERQVAFNTDGTLIAACHNNFPTVGLYDAATGDKLGALKGHNDPVGCVAFHPAGTLLASGSGTLGAGAMLRGENPEENSDRSVRLWGVPRKTAPLPEETPQRERKPLKQLGGSDEDDKEDSRLKPVQDWLNKLR